MEEAAVALSDGEQHLLVGVLQLHHLALQGLGQHRLHVKELAALAREVLHDLGHHLERDLPLAYLVEHLSNAHDPALKLGELIGEFLQQRHSGLGELPHLLPPKEGGGPHLPVGEDHAVHVHAKTRRDIGQHLRGVVQLVEGHGERRELLGVGRDLGEGVRRLQGQLLELAEQCVRPLHVLHDVAQRHPLHLELARHPDDGAEEARHALHGEIGGRHGGQLPEDALLSPERARGAVSRVGRPLLLPFEPLRRSRRLILLGKHLLMFPRGALHSLPHLLFSRGRLGGSLSPPRLYVKGALRARRVGCRNLAEFLLDLQQRGKLHVGRLRRRYVVLDPLVEVNVIQYDLEIKVVYRRHVPDCLIPRPPR